MTAATLPARRLGDAVTRLAVRQVRRGAITVAAVCGAMSWLVASQYQTTFRGSLDESGLRALAENPAIRVLLGPPIALTDPGGFTVWRTGTPILVLASVWILLAATRITRGDEEANRWDLLLAGPLRRVDATIRCLAALVGSAALIGVAVAAALLLAGTPATGTFIHACGIFGVTTSFAAAGVLAAQIMPTRAAATGLTVAALALAVALRMIADGVAGLAWSAWFTPFGLTARTAPYADNRVGPLAVLAVVPVALTAAAMLTASRRDLGSGIVHVRTSRPPRNGLLRSFGGFAVRRALRPTLGWTAGIGSYFLLVGAMIASILQFFAGNRRFADLASTAGFGVLHTETGFVAVFFSLLAIPTGLYASVRMGAFITDEKARRWTLLFAAPVSRRALLCTEAAITTAGMLGLHCIAALAIFSGAQMTGAPLSLTAASAAALNTASIAWLALGAATLAAGWIPSAVTAVGALPVVGGFLFDAVAQSTHAPHWVTGLSPFAHLAAVPASPPNWAATTAFVGIGAAMVAAGVVGYSRRDLTT